jgi:phosphinothricin acetyltransferase
VDHLVIRRANNTDAVDIARIYNHYIRTSTATFDTIEKSVEERTQWLAGHDDRHPVLVAELAGRVLGWGAIAPWGSRPGWRHTVELSIYVSSDSLGKGIGPKLLGALVAEARSAGHHALVSQVVTENEASLKMSERAGFGRVGTLREVGRKFDRWIDLALLEMVLE